MMTSDWPKAWLTCVKLTFRETINKYEKHMKIEMEWHGTEREKTNVGVFAHPEFYYYRSVCN